MNKDIAKKTFKVGLMVFLASFLIINWNTISWIFNYREVSGLVYDFFNPYPSIDVSAMDAYFSPNHSQNPLAINTPGSVEAKYTDKQNVLEIPKVSISVPIIFSINPDKAALEKDLDLGVVYYPGSVYPGQTGQIVILGHSAPLGWPKIKHDWVFTDLDKLEAGDTILVNFDNKQYTYIVKKKTIIERGADIPRDNSGADKSVLTLISCWPPGKDYQRITVQTELLGG